MIPTPDEYAFDDLAETIEPAVKNGDGTFTTKSWRINKDPNGVLFLEFVNPRRWSEKELDDSIQSLNDMITNSQKMILDPKTDQASKDSYNQQIKNAQVEIVARQLEKDEITKVK